MIKQVHLLRVFVPWWQKVVGISHKGTKSLRILSFLLITGFGLTSCVQHESVLVLSDSLLRTHEGITYRDQKPFTGKTFQLDQLGDTISLIVYENGKINGHDYAWYSLGVKKHERYYEQGRKEGVHIGWWPNGKLKFRYEFKDDEYEGSVKEWYEDGQLYRSFTYLKGHEDGPQKMWQQDGSIYANYVLKNNRIYGLSGRKNCKSLWKS